MTDSNTVLRTLWSRKMGKHGVGESRTTEDGLVLVESGGERFRDLGQL